LVIRNVFGIAIYRVRNRVGDDNFFLLFFSCCFVCFLQNQTKKVPNGPDTGYVGIVFGGIKLPPDQKADSFSLSSPAGPPLTSGTMMNTIGYAEIYDTINY